MSSSRRSLLGESVLDRPFTLLSVRPRRVGLDLRDPLTTGAGVFRRRELALLRLCIRIDDTESIGYGEAAPLAGWTGESLDACIQAAVALPTGLCFESIRALDWVLPELAEQPVFRSALELGLLDALCRHAGRPLAQALAGARGIKAQDSVPVQFTTGSDSTAATCRALGQAWSEGYRCAKIKVGASEPAQDIARIEQLASRFPGMMLRLDANGAWSIREALSMLRALPRGRIDLVEQPVSPERFDQLLAELARAPATEHPAVAADESCIGNHQAERLIRSGRCPAVVLKPSVLGGLLPAQEIIALAEKNGVRVVISNLMESAVGRAGIAGLAAAWPELAGPHGLATGSWFAADCAPHPDRIEHARLFPRSGPGIGFEPVSIA